jgi:hypothetical protein
MMADGSLLRSGGKTWGPVSPDNVHETGVPPGGWSGSPIDTPRPRRVENSKGDLVTGPIRRSCGLQGGRRSSGSGWELEQGMTDKRIGPSPCARRGGGRRPFVLHITHASMLLFVANVLMSRAG